MIKMSTGAGSFKALKYAVKFDPPCVFLQYEDHEGNTRVRAIKLIEIDASSDVDRLTRKVRKLVLKLVEHSRQHSQSYQRALSAQLQLKHTSDAAGNATDGHSAPATPSLIPSMSPKIPRDQNALLRSRPGLHALERSVRDSTESRFSTSTASLHPSLSASADWEQTGLHSPGPETAGKLRELDDMLDDLDKELATPFSPGPLSSPGPSRLSKLSPLQPLQRLQDDGSPTKSSKPQIGIRSQEATWGISATVTDDNDLDIDDESTHQSHAASTALETTAQNSTIVDDTSEAQAHGDTSEFLDLDDPETQAAATCSTQQQPPLSSQRHDNSSNDSVAGNKHDVDSDEELVILPDLPEDLNTVPEHLLQAAKKQMDETFRKNRLKPGDPDYVYDKQVEFQPASEPCDWDDEDD